MTKPADIILTNAKIITVDAGFSIAEAIAIADDRILAVGSAAEIDRHIAPETRIVDLKGQAVMPGLIDGHSHMDREGLKSVFPSLGKVRSIKDVQDRIAELARASRPGDWIVTMPIGDPPYYFDMPDLLAEKRWPTRQELDAAAPNNPVFIRSIWGFWRHTLPLVSCANSLALQRAGITRDTVSPVDTLIIDRDSQRRSDRRVLRERVAADRRAVLVPQRAGIYARRPRPDLAGRRKGLSCVRHHGHLRGARRRRRTDPRLQGCVSGRHAEHADVARSQPRLERRRRRIDVAVRAGVGSPGSANRRSATIISR